MKCSHRNVIVKNRTHAHTKNHCAKSAQKNVLDVCLQFWHTYTCVDLKMCQMWQSAMEKWCWNIPVLKYPCAKCIVCSFTNVLFPTATSTQYWHIVLKRLCWLWNNDSHVRDEVIWYEYDCHKYTICKARNVNCDLLIVLFQQYWCQALTG